jgi:hypothetical protein
MILIPFIGNFILSPTGAFTLTMPPTSLLLIPKEICFPVKRKGASWEGHNRGGLRKSNFQLPVALEKGP